MPETRPAKSWGARRSKLVQVLLEGHPDHDDVRLGDGELERIITWIDLNAPYYPTYASAYPDNLAGRSPLDDEQLTRLEELTGVPLRRLADHRNNRGPQVSFDRPELSPCLASIEAGNEAGRLEAVGLIRAGARALAQNPRGDHPDFQACALDQWREAKYRERRAEELIRRAALREGRKVYDDVRLPR